MEITLNRVFEIRRGNKVTKWKVIEHPYFDNALTLVKNYHGLYGEMRSGVCKEDYMHICGPTTLETAYEDAFIMS